MLLRPSTPADDQAVDAVHQLAFGGSAAGPPVLEVTLLRALRTDAGWIPSLSILAEDEATVVGHVSTTAGRLGDRPALGLGPIGVLPDRQGDGVGAALLAASVEEADRLGHEVIVLLGDPGYYERFGFGPAAALGIEPPDPAWGHHFQARAGRSWSGTGGPFRYAAPFDDL